MYSAVLFDKILKIKIKNFVQCFLPSMRSFRIDLLQSLTNEFLLFFSLFHSLMVVVFFDVIIGMGSCLSMGQWKELELQALIFRHLVEGATVPPQLLHHLVLSKSWRILQKLAYQQRDWT